MHKQIQQHFEESLRNFERQKSISPDGKISFKKLSFNRSQQNLKNSQIKTPRENKVENVFKNSEVSEIQTKRQYDIDDKIVKKVSFSPTSIRKSYEVTNKVVIQNKIKIEDQKEPVVQQQNKYFHPKLDFLFSNKEKLDITDKPYFMDGDDKQYEPEVIELRKSFKKDAEVMQSVFGVNYIQKVHGIILERFGRNGKLSSLYQIYLQILFILRKDLNDKNKYDDIRKMLQKEWRRESKGDEKMSSQQLFDSVFELVDIWTPEADKEQYCLFLEMLKMKIILDSEEPEEKPFIDVYDITEQ